MRISSHRRCAAVRSVILAGCLLLVSCGVVTAAPTPVVTFDVAQTVSCRVAAPPECAEKRPHAHVIEVVFNVSTRLTSGKEADLKSVTYEIVSPGRQLTVAGFSPMTTLASEAADGVISVEEHDAPAQLNLEYAGTQAKIQAPLRTPSDTKVITKKVAPKSLVISSGTFDRAHGVYFTLHPLPQDSVQRSQPLVCYFEVPETFRADYVHISCKAVAHDRSLGRSNDAELPAGSAKFHVGIYLDGDSEAKQAADKFASRQQQLIEAVLANHTARANRPKESASPTDMLKSVLHIVRKEPVTNTGAPRRQSVVDAKVNVQPVSSQVVQAQRAMETARRSIRRLNGLDADAVR